MLYAFVFICGLLAAGAYLLFFLSQVPGAVEDRFGAFDALPPNLGKWLLDENSPEAASAETAGKIREIRCFFQEGSLGSGGTLIRQVRFRDSKTREIVSVEPEVLIKRRRTRKKT